MHNAPTALVVDDDESYRGLVEIALTRLGHRVLTAESGSEALAIVAGPEKPGIAIVVTDLSMPGMDGHEFASKARESTYKRRLVIISGCLASTRYSCADLARVADDFFEKPYSLADLTTKLRSCIA